MRDFPKGKIPSLLLVVKNSKELEEVWNLWLKVKEEVFEEKIVLPCFGITEKNIQECMRKQQEIHGFTAFLISHNIHDCMLIDYLCKNIGG